jgi:hypothetical protein
MLRLDLSKEAETLINKIESTSIGLGDICYINYGAQLSSKIKGKFGKDHVIRDKRESPHHKPLVSGRNLYRYSLTWGNKYVDYSLATEMYGARFPEFFDNPKLMFRDITGTTRLEVTLDKEKYYCDHTILCAQRKCDISPYREFPIEERELSERYDLRYLLGVLNSLLVSFYYYLVLTGEGIRTGGGFHTYPETIRKLPIHLVEKADKVLHDKMVQLVESMLALHKHKALAKTHADQELYQRQIEVTDRDIDRLVYELYGLTPDEIATVEAIR